MPLPKSRQAWRGKGRQERQPPKDSYEPSAEDKGTGGEVTPSSSNSSYRQTRHEQIPPPSAAGGIKGRSAIVQSPKVKTHLCSATLPSPEDIGRAQYCLAPQATEAHFAYHSAHQPQAPIAVYSRPWSTNTKLNQMIARILNENFSLSRMRALSSHLPWAAQHREAAALCASLTHSIYLSQGNVALQWTSEH